MSFEHVAGVAGPRRPRHIYLAFFGFALAALAGCGDTTEEPPVDPNRDASSPDVRMPDPPSEDAGETPDVTDEASDAGAADADRADEASQREPDARSTDATDAPRAPSDASTDGDAVSCGACSAFGAPTATGPLPSVLTELSGIAASRRNPGVLYAHNDSGEGPIFFALSDTGTLLGEFALSGVTANDWEDVTVGACPAGWCVYLGDIGDNNLVYATHTIYRVSEPSVPPNGPVTRATVVADPFPFVYPDGRHNAETLLIEPMSGDLYVVTKVTGVASTVYRMPKPTTPGVEVTLERIGDLSLPASAGLVTGGDVHPCGNRMLIRTYPTIYEFVLPAGQSFSSIFTTPAVAVSTPTNDQESKGEGVTYATTGLGYFTASELDGKPSRSLYHVGCR